ncbi:Hydantoinase [Colletotrichum higginsianum IMI 349063]|uniref:Hydantoinase n=1 Tax=Colletotrichum higginsianum (strain IMI 349063) TaxID=759273 RepID=A0A1B7Y3D9_COLHI|nr:Hydantoinase [Colletotrichum higginsianum IMI 349063]OBR06512.1 Hydantoinase [Colletotrichum higginsianum IMI 349063]
MGSEVAGADPAGDESRDHELWRIGRAVAKGIEVKEVDNVAETLIEKRGSRGESEDYLEGAVASI